MSFISVFQKAYKELGLHSLIRTVRFNVHYFGKKNGLQLPVFIYDNVFFKQRLGKITLHSYETGGIKIGKCIVGVFSTANTEIQFSDSSEIHFGENVIIGSGCKIVVNSMGKIQIFDNVCITGNTMIICSKHIEIKKDCLLSWNVQIMDTDIHKLYDGEVQTNSDREVLIGESAWINSGCCILKGSVVANNCVVGANSLLNKRYEEPNCLIVGNPARNVKKNIKWER